jgi:hypothetical protein
VCDNMCEMQGILCYCKASGWASVTEVRGVGAHPGLGGCLLHARDRPDGGNVRSGGVKERESRAGCSNVWKLSRQHQLLST